MYMYLGTCKIQFFTPAVKAWNRLVQKDNEHTVEHFCAGYLTGF